MSEADTRDCCQGAQVTGGPEDLDKQSVHEACRQVIRDAIQDQLEGHHSSPIVVDGLPTIGKTHQATEVATNLDVPVAILTHRYETRDEHLELAERFDEHVAEIPAFDRTCPAKQGEHGDAWAEQLSDYRARGASPTYLHYYLQDALPCMEDDDCQYLKQWDVVEDAPVVIGGPAHAGLERIVDDRVVIFDEDPENTYRTDFEADELSTVVSICLQARENLPITNYNELQLVANNEEGFEDQVQTIREEFTDSESVARQSEAIRDGAGHAEAPTAILAMLELDGPSIGEASDAKEWEGRLQEEAELDFGTLPDGAQVVYDHAESRLIIRRPPNLESARAIVGLDGTPVEPLWQGRLGVDEITTRRVLCDECREKYLTEVVGYTFVQTSEAAKPYSSGTYVKRCSDYGLIEAVEAKHDTPPGIITTRRAEDLLFAEQPEESFVDRERVEAKIEDSRHYGNLRSSNEFQGTEVGIVMGSPHPGDRAIQITAALEGYTAIRDEDTRGLELSYEIPDRPFLRHYREHKVAQAALRFGRNTAATVYLHTGAIPDWLAGMVSHGPDDVSIDTRSEGQRSIITSLLEDGPGTAADIAAQDSVTVGEKHTRDMLHRLRSEGIVSRDGKQPYIWEADGVDQVPHTASVSLPECSEQQKS